MAETFARWAGIACALVWIAAIGPARAETPQNPAPDKLTVDAKEIVYDTDKKTISAVGNAKLYYHGQVLEADRVVYYSETSRVFAEGHVVLTDADGQVLHGTSMELSDQYRDGFINTLKIDTKDNTHFVAPRGERIGGGVTVFERGTFTACDACKDDPSKPPLWQVRARRIIHNQVEKVIYYEDATIDIAGVPVAYFPYFSAPDSTTPRKSGFLTPVYSGTGSLGQELSVPYYYVIAPDKDATVTPTFMTRQGVLLEGEYRQRFLQGDITVRGGAISQADRSAFLPSPNGAGDLGLRGYLETTGSFQINSIWNWGWDLAYLSDKWFLQNYRINSSSVTSLGTFRQESTSTAYLRGISDHSFFDARGYYFQSLLTEDNQRLQPLVLPVVDYDHRYHLTGPIAGELSLTSNLTNISRLDADFATLTGTCAAPYTTTNCYLRGIGGDYSRYTAEAAWRRSFIDPIGQSWTPFVSVRGDAANTTLFTNSDNSYQSSFIDNNTDVSRAMATAGVTYRYPFVAPNHLGTSIFEPIAQLIARPDETGIGSLPNEDAQSLVFDDSNLFSVDKFSGYDRVEGGTRANLGGQYTFALNNGAYTNVLFGQSFQVAGRNSFAQPGLVLEGTDSGLDKSASDYVSRIQIVPSQDFSFTLRGRFDPSQFQTRRFESEAATHIGNLGASLIYANYAAQPDIGITNRREGVGFGASYAINTNWSLTGNTLYSLSQYLDDPTASHMYLAALSAGATYHDECTDLSIQWIGKDPNTTGTTDSGQTLFFRLSLRTLGSIDAKQSTSN